MRDKAQGRPAGGGRVWRADAEGARKEPTGRRTTRARTIIVVMPVAGHELRDVLKQLIVNGGNYNTTNELVRAPGVVQQLLAFIEADSGSDLPVLLLSSQLLQQALRRCPLDDLPMDLFRRLLDILRAASSNASLALVSTQLSLATAVLVIRSTSLPADQILATLGSALQGPALLGGDRRGGTPCTFVQIVRAAARR